MSGHKDRIASSVKKNVVLKSEFSMDLHGSTNTQMRKVLYYEGFLIIFI